MADARRLGPGQQHLEDRARGGKEGGLRAAAGGSLVSPNYDVINAKRAEWTQRWNRAVEK